MATRVSRAKLMTACIEGVIAAEEAHRLWTGGLSLQAAPESLVQTFVARQLAELDVRLRLEASVSQLLEEATGNCPKLSASLRLGRVDIAVFTKSHDLRLIIELKKVAGRTSLDADHARLESMLDNCAVLQHGVLIGYASAIKPETVLDRLHSVRDSLQIRIVRQQPPIPVNGRDGKNRYLGVAIYRVDRRASPARKQIRR